MNFNFSKQPEYQLNTSLIEEVIKLYGILVKFLVTEKINEDKTVFGDYSHMKSDNNKIYDIYMLPEASEDWDVGGFGMSQFGLMSLENIVLFAAKSSFDPNPDNIEDQHEILGNLIVLPNNRIMEITNVEITTPGVNNLFTYNDAKSVYALTCKPYDFKLINELDNVDISVDPTIPYETLDVYFQELIGVKDDQDDSTQVTPEVTTIDKTTVFDTKVMKPIIDKSEDDVFGGF
jgi:ribosomal protein L21E